VLETVSQIQTYSTGQFERVNADVMVSKFEPKANLEVHVLSVGQPVMAAKPMSELLFSCAPHTRLAQSQLQIPTSPLSAPALRPAPHQQVNAGPDANELSCDELI
jgi:hypothetical protein